MLGCLTRDVPCCAPPSHCCPLQHILEVAHSINTATAAAAGGEGSAAPAPAPAAAAEDAAGEVRGALMPLPLRVIKTDKLLDCLRTPEVR